MTRDWVSRYSQHLSILQMKVRTTFYRRMLVMSRSCNEIIVGDPLPARFKITPLTTETRQAYLDLLPNRSSVLDKRLAQGSRCFLAWDGDRVAHAYWLGVERVHIDYLGCDLVLRHGEVYTFDSYTPASYRGQGLARLVGLHVLRLAQHEGYERAWCLPAVENKAGIRPVEAIGYRAVGTFHYLRLGPLQRRWEEAWQEFPLPSLCAPQAVADRRRATG